MTGKTGMDFVKNGIDIYRKRIVKYIPFNIKVIQDLKNTGSYPETVIKEKEGKLILSSVSDEDFLILLDEKGIEMNSRSFSGLIQNKMNTATKHLVFLTGGAYGFSEAVYARADEKMALSKMTFSHQIIRIIFMEQLYRALSIIHGDPYHHD